MIKRIDVQIWNFLLGDLGYFVSSVDMCCALGMSHRQLSARISKLRLPHVEKDMRDRTAYFKLDCGLIEAQSCSLSILADYFKCPESVILEIIMSVPNDRAVTLDEVYRPDGFTAKGITCILNTMPCIESIKTWSKNRYKRRDLNVQ